MANLVDNDWLNVQVICRYGDQIAINTFLYLVQNVVATPTDGDAADDLSLVLGGHIKACMSDDAEYRGLKVQKEDALNKYQPVYSTVGQGAGGVVGEPLPKQICGIITRRGNYAGRRHQGRLYVPFPSEASSDPPSGRPTIAYLAALGSYADDCWTVVVVANGGNSCNLVPRYRFTTGTPPVEYSFNYVSAIARDYWGTQRRRGDFGPKNISPI